MNGESSGDTDLFAAILLLADRAEVQNFFKDLCTPQEISALQERWRVCQLLQCGKWSYRDIHRLTGASLATIGRVARFLKSEEYGGYKKILQKINPPQAK